MSTQPTPAVSACLEDGTLVELIYDAGKSATAFVVARPGQATVIENLVELPNGERLAPYSASNNLLTSGCVLLPSDIGDFRDKRDLLEAIRLFLRRYVDLSPAFEEIAAHYVLLTWVYDAFNELGYLRFRGNYGTGKTRALLAVGSLCYKPFFASGASTVSPIFHILHTFRGTLVLDEADLRFSDATAELTKILNNGTVNGLPVLRTMANRHRELNPQAFRVYGPKLVAMREGFSDQALESRFLTEETGSRPLPPHIPIALPDSLAVEAQALRNQLLAWRFQARPHIGPDTARLVAGVEPRLNQTALALLSLVDDAGVRARISAQLVGEEARVRNERASSLEGTLLRAVLDAMAADPRAVTIGEVTRRLNAAREVFELPITSKRVGFMVRNSLRVVTTKSNGVYVIPPSEFARLKTLGQRFGLSTSVAAEERLSQARGFGARSAPPGYVQVLESSADTSSVGP